MDEQRCELRSKDPLKPVHNLLDLVRPELTMEAPPGAVEDTGRQVHGNPPRPDRGEPLFCTGVLEQAPERIAECLRVSLLDTLSRGLCRQLADQGRVREVH